jgi:hypothetical protein
VGQDVFNIEIEIAATRRFMQKSNDDNRMKYPATFVHLGILPMFMFSGVNNSEPSRMMEKSDATIVRGLRR